VAWHVCMYQVVWLTVPDLCAGTTLATIAVERMSTVCPEIVLETELQNTGALNLYYNLGFIRDKFLPMYYLNGGDAYRLKLWPSNVPEPTEELEPGTVVHCA